MATPFSFGFAGDDVDGDEAPEQQGKAPNVEHNAVAHEKSLPAKRHSLEDLVSNLVMQIPNLSRMVYFVDLAPSMTWNEPNPFEFKIDIGRPLSNLPSCVSYNYVDIPFLSNHASRGEDSNYSRNTNASHAGTLTIPRRSLFDIRTQLLAESTLDENGNDNLISGFDTGDLSSGFYEGGFKTWECAVDLAGFVAKHVTFTMGENWQVIELGAGSGIPSLAIFREALSRTGPGNERIKFTFCDYNEEVLNLVTMPNVLLSWWDVCINRGGTSKGKDPLGEADLDDINEGMAQRFIGDCKNKGITFNFISGAWGSAFVDLIESSFRSEADVLAGQHKLIILASETIYSPSSLTLFVNAVASLLRAARGRGTAYVAAKRIYFGVGGGVQEFLQEMQQAGALVKEVIDITDGGVGRVILEVSLV